MSVGTRTGLLTPKRLALLEVLRNKEPGKRPGQHAPSIVPIPRDKEMPLSFAEERLWFLHELDPESAVYNISGNIWFTGVLDIEALKRSFNEMTRRHETLRTTFVAVDGIPTKVITPELTIDMPVVDLRHLSEEAYRAEVERLATEEVLKPFDLARGPLLRLTWVRLREGENLVLATKHHIISDGWSVGGFLYELATLYEAFSSGKPSPLGELEIQSSDYAYWQRNWLQGEILAEHVAFWKQQLQGAPALLELPTDHPRPAVQSYRGGWTALSLPLELSRAIRSFSRHEEVTLFMTLLAAFQTLLYRYSSQEDIVVGTPMSSRSRLETEALLGVVFNTLVLRVSLAGDPTFRELVRRGREVALNAYAHQDLPFEQLVEALQPERSLSHTPIFQVMFVHQNSPMPEFRLPNLTVRKFAFHSQTSKFDLSWSVDDKDAFVYEKEQPLTGLVEYSTDLFEPGTIERMLGHYQTLLEAAVANPDLRLSQLPLLLPAERHQLREWNATDQPYPDNQCLSDLFRAQLERSPEATALVYGREALSFRDLHARANRLAHHLQQHGVGPETVVAICLERTPELIVAMLAVLQAGGAYLPLDPAYPTDRLAFMLADAHAAVVVTDTSLLERVPRAGAEQICLDRDWERIAQSPASAPPSAATPENLAYLIYTSGSTGRPKGVAITHGNAVNLLAWARDAFPPEDRAGLVAATSVCFDLSIFELFLPLAYGGTVILARDVLELPELPAAEAITLINTVPSALTELLRQGALPPQIRSVNLAGERLPAELVQSLAARHPGVRIVNLYGPSETTTYSSAATLDPVSADAPPIGCPIANTHIHVLDREGQLTPIGVPGELYIGGVGVARGYLDRPELTAERFVPDPFSAHAGARLYRTGDLGRWRSDGQLEFLGRNDHQVKVRGFRIELGEIEHVLGQHPGVSEAVVVARVEGADDVRLVAYVVPREGAGELGDLRTFVKERLPEYMVPNVVVALEQLPRTPNGKIDRRALPDPVRRRDHTSVMTPPRTATERLLAAVWQAVLRVEHVSVHDNFFTLGGHSLLATRAVARIRQEAGVELPLRAIFEAPTVEELARVLGRLQASRSAPQHPAIRPAARTATAPLSSTQQRLWFLAQLDPASTAYAIPNAFRIAGPLDTRALQRSLEAIVERHESLRTTFALVGPEPLQETHPALPLEVPVVSLRGLSKDAQEAEILRCAQAEARKPFELDRGPLVRAALLALGDDQHVLLLTMHHIISDGWSIGILLNELAGLYDAFSGGEPARLPTLPIQFADFAIWQREWLQSDALKAQVAYWRRQLAGAPPVLNLPTDFPRPAVQAHRGARRTFALSQALSEALGQFSRQHNATLFMTLLSAWQALLSGYSGETDISVGSPIAGRTRGETEGLIGCFVNTLVLRSDLSGDPSFVELLQRVRQMTLDAYTNQDAPFEYLVEALQPERSLGYSPLFQVMFILQNTPLADLVRSNLHIEPIDLPGESSKFDLTLALMETPTGLRGGLEYNVDLFDGSTIERMIVHYEELLHSVVSRPDVPLTQLLPVVPTSTRADPRAVLGPRQIGPRPSGPAQEPPRTATERVLARIWQDLLRVTPVGVYDDFFALGGHSLLAVQLLVRIRETFQTNLELRSLFEAPTIAELALLIDGAGRPVSGARSGAPTTARSPLVTLHEAGGGETRCFCIHPGGGQIFWYRRLALHLGADVTVYGVEARGLDGAQPPHVRIESMASSYLDAIQAVQPEGPYRLVGWSLGGIVAFEMAQQLAMHGQDIGLLALLDTRLIESVPETIDESIFPIRFMQDLAALYGKHMPSPPEGLDRLSVEEQFVALVRQAQDAQVLPPEIGLPQLQNQFRVFRANAQAMLAYQVRPYPGRISLFLAQQSRDTSASWSKLARGGFEKRTVPGNHYTMLRSPQVEVLAEQLRACLEQQV